MNGLSRRGTKGQGLPQLRFLENKTKHSTRSSTSIPPSTPHPSHPLAHLAVPSTLHCLPYVSTLRVYLKVSCSTLMASSLRSRSDLFAIYICLRTTTTASLHQLASYHHPQHIPHHYATAANLSSTAALSTLVQSRQVN